MHSSASELSIVSLNSLILIPDRLLVSRLIHYITPYHAIIYVGKVRGVNSRKL